MQILDSKGRDQQRLRKMLYWDVRVDLNDCSQKRGKFQFARRIMGPLKTGPAFE